MTSSPTDGITLVPGYSTNSSSTDSPELIYQSNYLDAPFPRPLRRIQLVPAKSAHGVFNTPLSLVWHIVAPGTREMLKKQGVCYSAIHAVRFVAHGEDGQDTLGPIIAIHPTPKGNVVDIGAPYYVIIIIHLVLSENSSSTYQVYSEPAH